jgi:hypothetical protein
MQSTPVSIASPKLCNSSPIASASPTVVCRMPGGSWLRLGSASASFSTSPRGNWLSIEVFLPSKLSAKLPRIGWWGLAKSACGALYGNLLVTAHVR